MRNWDRLCPSHSTVRQVSPLDPDRRRALSLILGIPTANATVWSGDDEAVTSFIDDAARRGLVIDVLAGVFEDGQIRFACLLVESPGHAALLLAPWSLLPRCETEAAGEAIRHLLTQSQARGVTLIETLIPESTEPIRRCLNDSGFRPLTQLIYLQRRIDLKDGQAFRACPELTWVSYTRDQEGLFLEALEASYESSLDCPELCGVRPVHDVLAGHRASGDFDPSLWWVARRGNQPVGVLLLSRFHGGAALEIVYMGVAQPFRGTGVSDALIGRAIDAARGLSAKRLSLAVDNRNGPARRLYERWRFTEFTRREAWIAIHA